MNFNAEISTAVDARNEGPPIEQGVFINRDY